MIDDYAQAMELVQKMKAHLWRISRDEAREVLSKKEEIREALKALLRGKKPGKTW